MKTSLRILFIGNSHTYYHDMPCRVRRLAEESGVACEVVMLAHGGWFLEQHVSEPEARFNILFGHYDYVVLQEHTHPFAPERKYKSAVAALNEWIGQAGGRTVLYETWARQDEPEKQAEMSRAQRSAAEEIGAVLAPVGEQWQPYQQSHPELALYAEDGAHASEQGAELAARVIWASIWADCRRGSIGGR
ncbi:MAG: SGNH/GDSL hydrolase family protein [Eubacteriales bacterium]|nr:SGNH/GDSL hydrolase family protein [Eubacteriales bacterium]